MADYHIGIMSKDLKTIEVVFHLPISALEVNQAEIKLRDAVVMHKGGVANIKSELSAIVAEEKTRLESGAIIEVKKTVRFSSIELTNAQRKAEVEAEFKRLQVDTNAEKTKTLAFYGLAGMVK